MDKLEKALEKARRERDIYLPQHNEQHAPQTGAAPAETETTNVEERVLERSRIVAHHKRSAEADTFKLLRTQVLQAMKENGLSTLAITSAHYGDGKSTIAANLAMSVALDLKQTVLLVDLDLRKPSLHKMFGIPARAGLTEHLSSGIPLSDCFVRLSLDRLSLLPAGNPIDRSSEILASPHMAALADEMKSRYPDRLIIYDMPPLLVQDDPLAFLPYVDGVLLVVKEGVTTEADLGLCRTMLADAKVVGTVLNDSAAEDKRPLWDRLF